MPVDATLADPTAEPNDWLGDVLIPWVADVSGTIATLEAGGGSAFTDLTETVVAGLLSDTSLATANTTLIQAAIDAGGTFVLPAGQIPVNALTWKDDAHAWGQGDGTTTLALVNGANTSLITTENFATLTGTDAVGCVHWSINKVRLEGNAGSQSGTSIGLRIYGGHYTLFDVTVHNFRTNALYSEWAATPTYFIVGYQFATIVNCQFMETGESCVIWNGPLDSWFVNCSFSQAANKGFASSANYHTLHVQNKGTSTQFKNCHLIGTVPTYPCKTENAAAIYWDGQAEGAPSGGAVFKLLGPNSIIRGRVFNASGVASRGVQIGESGTTPGHTRLDFSCVNLNSGAVDFTYDGGGTAYHITGHSTTGTTHAGDIPVSSFGVLSILNSGSGVRNTIDKLAGVVLFDAGASYDVPLVLAADAAVPIATSLVYVNPSSTIAAGDGWTIAAGQRGQRLEIFNVNAANSGRIAGASLVTGVDVVIAPMTRAIFDYRYGWYGGTV